jgi:FixJ family two-component response regulator
MKPGGEITVAVVDDDAGLCRALSRLLRGWEMRAVAYPSAEAFLQDPHRPPLNCLILDIQLGGMSC